MPFYWVSLPRVGRGEPSCKQDRGVPTVAVSWPQAFLNRTSSIADPGGELNRKKVVLGPLIPIFTISLLASPSDSIGRREWQPTPIALSGKSHGQRSLVGCRLVGSLRVGHDWATSLSLFTFMHWRRKWQPTPALLPGESQGRGARWAAVLWGHTESDRTGAI